MNRLNLLKDPNLKDESQILMGQIFEVETNIKLMLSPQEKDHRSISFTLVQLRRLARKIRYKDGEVLREYQNCRRTLGNTATRIIKSEWRRLKYELLGWGAVGSKRIHYGKSCGQASR
jgi:hypothetical protein